MAKTRFFRIAVEGATVDGRTIDRAWIDQMAAGYDPKTYTARINCEHIPGYSPEPPFNSYGSVLALRAVDVELQIDGKPKKLRSLEAQLDANDQLIAVNAKGQKLFTSCEIAPNFANTGKAGLVGLAITDNPASLGTEMLEFAAKASVNPLAARKQDAANYFSAVEEAKIELEAAPAADTAGIADAIKSGFTALGAMFSRAEPEKPKEPEPVTPANDNFDVAAFTAALGDTMATAIAAAVKPVNDSFAALQGEVTQLKGKLESTDPNPQRRTFASGGAGAPQADF